MADAVDELRHLPYEEIEVARVDHHRELRDGLPEAVYGESKTPEQVLAIAKTLLGRSDRLIVTRATPEKYELLRREIPDARYNDLARTITVDRVPLPVRPGVAVLCAGTADLPVAEEAAETATIMGAPPVRLYDVGVAGIAPLLAMLNACAPGVSVVNIDNGFGAGYLAATINRLAAGD